MLHKTFLVCCCFAASCGFAQPGQMQVDSLKNVLQQHRTKDSNRVLTLIRYANALFYRQPDSSLMNYANEALQIAENIKWDMGIARSLQLKAAVYNSFWSDPIRALDCYQKALSINESIADKGFQWTTLVNIGIIHFNLNEYEQALHYYNLAYTIEQQLPNKKGEDQLLMTMAQVYAKLKLDTKAEEFYTKSIALAEKSGNIQIIANSLCSRGLLYQSEKKLTLAETDLQKGISLAKKYNLISVEVVGMVNLAQTYIDLKNYSVAEKNAQEALQICRQMHLRQLESETLGTLADLYTANGNTKKALACYEQYQPIHDSLSNDETKQSLIRMEMQYQFKQKEDSIKAGNEKQQALAAANLDRQHVVNNSIMAGAGILLLAGFVSFIFYKKRRDAEGQKQEAEFLTQVADTEMKALRAQMNPHFIFNSLNSISNFIVKNNTQAADYYLIKFTRLMRQILENSEEKEISLADDLNALELYMQLEALRLNDKFTYEIKVDDAIDKEMTLIPPLILQPFVENSIWHGISQKEGKGKILIAFEKEGEMINCIVEDNGVGKAKTAMMKAPNDRKKSFGIKVTKARIYIINRLKQSNATVTFFDLEEGMRVEVRLPLEVAY